MKTVKEIKEDFIEGVEGIHNTYWIDSEPPDFWIDEFAELAEEYHRQMSWRDEYDKAMDE